MSWPAEILPPDGPSLKFISRSFLDPTYEYLVERETYYNSDFTAEKQQYQKCSVSRWRPQKVDKCMVLEYTHGLFIT